MSTTISPLTDATFDEEVKASEAPVLVDFWAEWCGPCRTLHPILDEIAGENADTLRIAKVNVDENPGLAQRFEVMSIPTLILFKDGVATDLRIVGAKAKAALLADLKPYLSA